MFSLDSIDAGAGDDSIDAGDSTDTINAGTGNDTVLVSERNFVDGGAGRDVFQLKPNSFIGNSRVTVNGGEGKWCR